MDVTDVTVDWQACKLLGTAPKPVAKSVRIPHKRTFSFRRHPAAGFSADFWYACLGKSVEFRQSVASLVQKLLPVFQPGFIWKKQKSFISPPTPRPHCLAICAPNAQWLEIGSLLRTILAFCVPPWILHRNMEARSLCVRIVLKPGRRFDIVSHAK